MTFPTQFIDGGEYQKIIFKPQSSHHLKMGSNTDTWSAFFNLAKRFLFMPVSYETRIVVSFFVFILDIIIPKTNSSGDSKNFLNVSGALGTGFA